MDRETSVLISENAKIICILTSFFLSFLSILTTGLHDAPHSSNKFSLSTRRL